MPMLSFYVLRPRILVVLCTLASGLTPFCGAADSIIPPTQLGIKTEIVLRIGPVNVSWYVVDKNLTRFRRSLPRGNTSSAETKAWFELYLARQVIIARALGLGYAERPEVIRIVESMERHMLAQIEEPISQLTDTELHSLYNQIQPPTDQPKPSFEEMKPFLNQTLVQQRRLAFKHTQRERVLTAAHIKMVHETAEKLIERIHAEPRDTADIPSELLATLAEQPLASYDLANDTITLSVEAWRDHFNRLFVRALPTDMAQMEANIQDLVVADYAHSDARQRGREREPQFVEDRRNFLYYQALDLFEREQLLPQIQITEAESEAYYHEHLAKFFRPARARGSLFRFTDEASALAWLRTSKTSATEYAGEEIEISREYPIAGARGATEAILRMEAGNPFGPIRTADGVIMFLKRATEVEQQSYSSVVKTIRTILTQSRLDALELKLAREWGQDLAIEDRLYPEEFNIIGSVQKPWIVQ